MKLSQFLKAPEKAISEMGSIEWEWTRRQAVVGSLAAFAVVSALTLHSSEINQQETVNVVPTHEVVEVDG